jgi:TRAP-type C4-dicarboxylate transport system substrate-binding protein
MNKSAFTALLLLLPLSACGTPDARTGTSVEPVQLTVVQDLPVFSRLVPGTADSAVRIVTEALLPESPDPEADLLAGLADGDFDLAVVRAGRLEREGAGSLAPLGAPFLITNDQQAAAVATGAVASELMADVEQIELVGLALVPEGLRHPFGYGSAPLLGAADYKGQVIASAPDAGSAAILRALGATVFEPVDHTRSEAAQNGELRGIETNLDRMGIVDRPAVVTGNVSLYYRFDVLVIRKAAWDGLTGPQQAELSDAVAKARNGTVTDHPKEAESFASWCAEDGAASVDADSDALASLHALLDPITDAIEADAATGGMVQQIRELGDGTTDPSGLTCDGQTPEPTAGVTPSGDQSVLDGVWRFEVSEQDLLDGGASESDAHGNAGIWEFDVQDGSVTVSLNGHHQPSTWAFTFDGESVALDFGPDGGVLTGTYALVDDTVTFTWDVPEDAEFPWIPLVLFHQAVRVT